MNHFYVKIDNTVYSFHNDKIRCIAEQADEYIRELAESKRELIPNKEILYVRYTDFYHILSCKYNFENIQLFKNSGKIPFVFICYLDSRKTIIRVLPSKKFFTHKLNGSDEHISICRTEKSNLIVGNLLLTYTGYMRPIDEFVSTFV